MKNRFSRKSVGMKAGIVGLISNLTLTVIKLIAGYLSKSQALLADGINSLSDTLSSLITIIGFYISGKPADEDHPYGHERSEYIAGFIIAIITGYLGFDIAIKSFKSLLTTDRPIINWLPIIIMIVSIIFKIFLVYYYKKNAKKINSKTLEAAGQDSFNDILMTFGILIALLLSPYFSLNIDAIVGLLVSIYIIYSSIQMITGFIHELLGNRPDENVLVDIKEILDNDKSIFGYHDLLVHQYGNETSFGSVHVELDQSMSLIKAHDILDNLENLIFKQTGIKVVAHADPLDIDNMELHKIFQLIKNYLRINYPQASFHDLRLVNGVLKFDVVLNGLTCRDDIILELGALLIKNRYNYSLDIEFDIQQLI